MEYAFESLGPTLRYVALVFLLVFAVAAMFMIVLFAALPGQIAKRVKHPQANAINVCGWLGLPTGVLWVIAMVWAFSRRPSSEEEPLACNEFDAKLNRLEQTIQQIEKQFGA